MVWWLIGGYIVSVIIYYFLGRLCLKKKIFRYDGSVLFFNFFPVINILFIVAFFVLLIENATDLGEKFYRL